MISEECFSPLFFKNSNAFIVPKICFSASVSLPQGSFPYYQTSAFSPSAVHVHYLISNLPQKKKKNFGFILLLSSLRKRFLANTAIHPTAESTAHLVTQHRRHVRSHTATAPCFTSTNAIATPKRCQNASFIMRPRNVELKFP